MASYIPSKEADLINWGLNYTTLISATPLAYGLTAGDAASLASNFAEFQTAYNLAINPSTRTIATVAAKDEQKAGFLSLARSYAAIIRANQSVTNEQLAALGLTVRDSTPTVVPVPTSVPVINVPLAGPSQQYMTIADQYTPTSKAKPQGVAGMLLFRKTAATPQTNFVGAQAVGLFTKADQLLDTSGLTAGEVATYWGRWYNRKGQLGPLSAPASAVIQ